MVVAIAHILSVLHVVFLASHKELSETLSFIQALHPVHGFSRNESYTQNSCSMVVNRMVLGLLAIMTHVNTQFSRMQSVICTLVDYSTLAPQWKQDMIVLCVGCSDDTWHNW